MPARAVLRAADHELLKSATAGPLPGGFAFARNATCNRLRRLAISLDGAMQSRKIDAYLRATSHQTFIRLPS
jgi:hypothetical protein